MDSSRRTEGFALALTAAVLWGLGPTATKLSLAGYPPEIVGVARLGSAALLFRLLGGPTTRWLPRDASPLLSAAAYLVESIAIGILAAKLIETPFLKLRDRLFPTRSSASSSF